MEADPKLEAQIKLLKELMIIDRNKFMKLPKEVQEKVVGHLIEDPKGEKLQSNYAKWFDEVDPGTGVLDFDQFKALLLKQRQWSDENFGGHVQNNDEELLIRWKAL